MSQPTTIASTLRDAPAQMWNDVLGSLTGRPPELGPGAKSVRLRTFMVARWIAVAGQSAAVMVVQFGFGFDLPLVACLMTIAASAAVNLFLHVRFPFSRRLSMTEATAHAAFDITQIAVILGLTGGLVNPFTLLMLAPLTISASVLNLRSTVLVGVLAIVLISVMAFVHVPLPWYEGAPLRLEPVYVAGIWVSMAFAIMFNSAYAWWVSRETDRMHTALAAAQQVLSREQRLAAMGGLAAAAAHELGTPLATIALVAKEMSRDLPADNPHFDDVKLMRDQAERCRQILSRLSREPDEGDSMMTEMPLRAVLESIAMPHRDMGIAVDVTALPIGMEAGPEPRITRRPEILYGLGNFVENAVDFACARVKLAATWSKDHLRVRISDDGPGFAPEIMDRLGEPYITTRPPRPGEGAFDDDGIEADGQHGMGLGFFIAKTLLERTGAVLSIANSPGGTSPGERGGAVVTVRWPIHRIRTEGREGGDLVAGRDA